MIVFGMCSQLLQLFTAMVYFEHFKNRTVWVDESLYHYRRNADQGVLTGFFTSLHPTFR